MRKLIVVGAALSALCFISGARAVVLLSDSFTYPDGALVTVSTNWVHHSGSITGEVKVVAGRVFLSQTNSEDVNASLAGGPYSSGTNVLLYASFTANFASLPTGAGTYFAHFMASASTFRGKIFATTNGAAPGAFRIGLANVENSPNVTLTVDIFPGTNFVLVTRYAPSNAISTLWLNPAAETDPGVTAADTVTTASINAYGLRESFSSPNGMGSLYLDNLVVGTSFNDVLCSNAPPAIVTPPQ